MMSSALPENDQTPLALVMTAFVHHSRLRVMPLNIVSTATILIKHTTVIMSTGMATKLEVSLLHNPIAVL